MQRRCLDRPPWPCPVSVRATGLSPATAPSPGSVVLRADSGRRAGPAAAEAWCRWWLEPVAGRGGQGEARCSSCTQCGGRRSFRGSRQRVGRVASSDSVEAVQNAEPLLQPHTRVARLSDGVHPPAGSAASVPPGSDATSRWACESVAPAVDISTTSRSPGEPEPPSDDAGASRSATTVLAQATPLLRSDRPVARSAAGSVDPSPTVAGPASRPRVTNDSLRREESEPESDRAENVGRLDLTGSSTHGRAGRLTAPVLGLPLAACRRFPLGARPQRRRVSVNDRHDTAALCSCRLAPNSVRVTDGDGFGIDGRGLSFVTRGRSSRLTASAARLQPPASLRLRTWLT